MLLKDPKTQSLFGIVEDHQELDLSLDSYLIKNPSSTYFLRLGSNELRPNFQKGDILIVDRSLKISSGELGAFYYQNNPIIRWLIKNNSQTYLCSAQKKEIINTDELMIFGKVVGLARKCDVRAH